MEESDRKVEERSDTREAVARVNEREDFTGSAHRRKGKSSAVAEERDLKREVVQPGAVAVPRAGINENDGQEVEQFDEAEETEAASEPVYVVQATPVEEIIATEIIPEEIAETHEGVEDVHDDQNQSYGAPVSLNKSPAVPLNLETVNFDEQCDDVEAGTIRDFAVDGTYGDDDEVNTATRRRYILTIGISIIYFALVTLVIFLFVVPSEEKLDDPNDDPCKATRLKVLHDLEMLRGKAMLGYILSITILFVMIFQWRRYETDDGSRKVLFCCSASSLLLQTRDSLSCLIYLILHLFWLFVAVAILFCIRIDDLTHPGDKIAEDCDDEDDVDADSVWNLLVLSIPTAIQVPMLLYRLGGGVGQLFFGKLGGGAEHCDRRTVRAMLVHWAIAILLSGISSLGVFGVLSGVIDIVEDLEKR